MPLNLNNNEVAGVDLNNTEVSEVRLNGQTVFTAEQAEPYNVTDMTFDTSTNVQSKTNNMAWNDDGSRLYFVNEGQFSIFGENDDGTINQYTVSTPYDITTASLSTSISSQGISPNGIAWNDDGSKLYVAVAGFLIDPRIFQYTVSTPFDIDTASLDTNIAPQDPEPRGIAWNDDGTRLYELGREFGPIFQSTVSTPYDITSASLDTSISTQDSRPEGIAWNDDGSRLYEVGRVSEKIYQYTVSTPFDISSASFSTSINTQDTAPAGIAWNDDGTRLYEAAFSNIYQYTL